MENWNTKEVTGNQYVYVSLQYGNDTLAKNYFGCADVWQNDTLGTGYTIGTKRRDSASSTNSSYKQFKAITNHNKGATTPNADTTNWSYDTDCFQEYLSTAIYPVSGKTVYNNEHYVCNYSGTTGTFDLTKWTKVNVSNSTTPFYSVQVAGLVSDFITSTVGYNNSRFVSYEQFNQITCNYDHKFFVILGSGTHTLATQQVGPQKLCRIVGGNKTILNYNPINYSGGLITISNCYVNLTVMPGSNAGGYLRFDNCRIYTTPTSSYGGWNYFVYLRVYNSIFLNTHTIYIPTWLESVGSTLNFTAGVGYYIYLSNWIKSTYFKNPNRLISADYTINNKNVLDFNCYAGGMYVDANLKTTLSDIQAAIPYQNVHSIVNSSVTFTDVANYDYTLPDSNSPLYRTGLYGRNIGCTNIGFKKSELDVFSITSGATYKNIKIEGGLFKRDQISKLCQTATNVSITLNSSASSVDEEYTGFRIKIVSGTGVGLTNVITAYNGTTKVASVSAWGTPPDGTSVYDILDGEVYSPKIDLGRVVRLKNAQFISTFLYDVNGKPLDVLDWTTSDGSLQGKLTFKMNYSTDDITYSGLKEFLIEEPLRIDSNGYGNGDANFVRTNQVDSTINVRYCYINFALREI
jgi:hypothetical protein